MDKADEDFDDIEATEEPEDLLDRDGTIEETRDGDEMVLTYVDRGKQDGIEMLRSDLVTGRLRIFPKFRKNFGYEDRFAQITEIQIEHFGLQPGEHSVEGDRLGLFHVIGLPRGFAATYQFGLGIMFRYRGLIDELEEHTNCTVVRFVGAQDEEGPDGDTFRLRLNRFEDYRALVDRNRSRATTAVHRVLVAERRNMIADLFALDRLTPKYGRDPVIRAITEEVSTGHVVDPADRATLVSRVRDEASKAARESPVQFGLLREDVELVSLEVLIEEFEKGLTGKSARDEGHWQKFFAANPFALQQVFGAPVVIAREQAQVQAGDIDGRGSRITDFLCVNTVTRTAMVVEIKTPAARLLATKPYRGKGTAAVFAPHPKDLAGAVSQVQAQMEAVPRDLKHRLGRSSDLSDVDPWHTLGAVIVGRVSALTTEERESFLRYRSGLSGVTVLGYDEVAERLKGLLSLLRDAPAQPSSVAPDDGPGPDNE